MACMPTLRCFMYRARNYRAYYWNCTLVCNQVVCCLARTHAAITRKAGVVGATARIMISILGAAMCQPRDFLSLITITAPPDYPRQTALVSERLASVRRSRHRTACPLIGRYWGHSGHWSALARNGLVANDP